MGCPFRHRRGGAGHREHHGELDGADSATIGRQGRRCARRHLPRHSREYGFIGPIASSMTHAASEEGKAFEVVKMALVASVRGYVPSIAIEFARKLPHERRAADVQ